MVTTSNKKWINFSVFTRNEFNNHLQMGILAMAVTALYPFYNPQSVVDVYESVLDSLLKASSVLPLPDMVLSSDGTTVVLTVKDKKNSTSNVFSKTVAQGNGSTYEMFLRMENIKVIPGDYTVFVSSQGIAQFTNRKQAVEYFIALEPDSNYTGS